MFLTLGKKIEIIVLCFYHHLFQWKPMLLTFSHTRAGKSFILRTTKGGIELDWHLLLSGGGCIWEPQQREAARQDEVTHYQAERGGCQHQGTKWMARIVKSKSRRPVNCHSLNSWGSWLGCTGMSLPQCQHTRKGLCPHHRVFCTWCFSPETLCQHLCLALCGIMGFNGKHWMVFP